MCGAASAERVKDLASVAGVRDNPMLGYGLVVGLDGTGDSTGAVSYTEQSLRSMLVQYGITVPPGTRLSPKNVAAVTVSAVLPPFAKPGQQIDVTVSSLGTAKSLRGGTLLMSPLRGADGEVYAIAQGNLVVGGLGVEGADGSSLAINVPSVGRIPRGASVERAVPTPFAEGEHVVFNLHEPDFTSARRLVDGINEALGDEEAEALDAVSVAVRAPVSVSERVAFVSFLEELVIEPGEGAGKVIVNSRTGTIVIGSHVTVGPAAVAHGSLVVRITERPRVSQPAPALGRADGRRARVLDRRLRGGRPPVRARPRHDAVGHRPGDQRRRRRPGGSGRDPRGAEPGRGAPRPADRHLSGGRDSP